MILDYTELRDLEAADKHYLESFTVCKNLSLQYCKLRTLGNLPSLSQLVRLDVSNNALLGKDLGNVAACFPNLETLKLANNLIKSDWESMKGPLQKMSETLINLDLSCNPISDSASSYYREQMFELLPKLEVLDGKDKDGKYVDSDNEESEEEEVKPKKVRGGERGLDEEEEDEEEDGEYGEEEEEDKEYKEEDDIEEEYDVELPGGARAGQVEEDDDDDEDEEGFAQLGKRGAEPMKFGQSEPPSKRSLC